MKCELPGCQPGLPYKIIGDSVSFLVPEIHQGVNDTPIDLDGNGHTDDIVVVVYTVPSAATQVLASASLNGGVPVAATPPGGIPPTLPTTFTDGTIVYKQVRESDIGRDLNEDGDMDDVVTLVDGDSDGVFDSQDGCVEAPNADQRDSDGDGLPDAVRPEPVLRDRDAGGAPGRSERSRTLPARDQQVIRKLFDTQGKVTRACLEKIARGKLDGDPTALCRGGIANGAPILPGDPGTATKIAKAAAKVTKTAMTKCADLTQLQACGSDPASLAACAAARSAETASLLTDLVYGPLGTIVDPTALRCQRVIGKASGKYLTTVAKAMASCLDRLNEGKLSGSGDTLGLGGGTGGGITLPSDPGTGATIQGAGDAMQAAVTAACPGTTLAGLQACGTDPTGLAACVRCTHGRQAIAEIRAAYGPP